MNYGEIDILVNKYMKANFHAGSERRSYFDLEREDISFKGYGERNGLMYLADVMDSYYADVKIKPKTENIDEGNGTVNLVFRDCNNELIDINFSFDDFSELYMTYFISLIWEYLQLEKRWISKVHDFSRNIVSSDFTRDAKIKKVLK